MDQFLKNWRIDDRKVCDILEGECKSAPMGIADCGMRNAVFGFAMEMEKPNLRDLKFPHSAFRIPHSAFRIPHSAFRIPHSVIGIPH